MCDFKKNKNKSAHNLSLCFFLFLWWRQEKAFYSPSLFLQGRWAWCHPVVSPDSRAERLSLGREKRNRWRWNRSVSHFVLCLCQITQETSQTHMQLLEAWFRSTLLHQVAQWNKRIMVVLLDTGTLCAKYVSITKKEPCVSAICACHTICSGKCFCSVREIVFSLL